MSSSQLPNTAIPMPLPDDADDVSWALQTAAVQWGRGACEDAIVWLRRAADSAIEASKWSRAADLNATATRLEKQLSKGSLAPISTSPPESNRPAMLPSFPAASRPSTQSLPSLSEALSSPPTRRGGRNLPTPPAPKFRSFPAATGGDFDGRASIDIEAGVGELTEEELRAIEAEDVPPGALEQWRASQPQPSRPPPPSSLPAFELESTKPPQPPSARGSLPAFSLESSVRPPPPSLAPNSADRTVVSKKALPSSLPSFQLDPGTSSLPPVSKWPKMGSRGTSHIPPHPALPSFEAVPPSRPFVEESDDVPGIEANALPDSALEELEPLEISVSEPPPLPSVPVASISEPPSLDLVEIGSSRASTKPLQQLSVRSGRASARARISSAPLPPALPEIRPSMAPRTVPAAPRLSTGAPAAAETSRPPVPGRSSAPMPEPRMPKRTLSYASPLDFGNRSKSEPSRGSGAPSPTSAAPTINRMEIAEPVSVPPPSARSIEPEDLPTVSSPNLTSRPPLPEPRTPSESSRPAYSREARDENRRLSFRFEEPRTLERASQQPGPQQPSSIPSQPPLEIEEPPASLPPVSVHPSREPSPGDLDEESVVLSGIRLADVRGFSELPASALRMLAESAHIETLSAGEEASFFSVALVLDGWVALMPAIADTTCATAVVGEVVFTEGTLSDGLMLRVVAGQDSVVVATWDADAIAAATKNFPWLADELKLLADGFQALAGACLGPLGDRLDDSLRSIVTSRCEIRTLMPGEQMCAAGKPVPGMHIIGGGEIELVDESGRVAKTHGTGEFLFAPQVLAGGVAPYSARAGSKGALVLFAARMAAHELLVSVPPLLEILAE